MSKRVVIPEEAVMNKIYLVRDQKIMLDRDLGELYGAKAIRLREQVKRNLECFPGNFMFQLTETEVENKVSQFAIPSKQHQGGTLPYAFTEHGILMLANVLKSEQAITMSIRIIENFCKASGRKDNDKLDCLVGKQTRQLELEFCKSVSSNDTLEICVREYKRVLKEKVATFKGACNLGLSQTQHPEERSAINNVLCLPDEIEDLTDFPETVIKSLSATRLRQIMQTRSDPMGMSAS